MKAPSSGTAIAARPRSEAEMLQDQECSFDPYLMPVESGTGPRRAPLAVTIARLRLLGYLNVAEQLYVVSELIRKDRLEDPDEAEIDLDSVQHFADFVTCSGDRIEDPSVSVDPKGHIQMTWEIPPRGMSVMAFRPDGSIRYGASSAPIGQPDRDSESGTAHHPDMALHALQRFLPSRD